MGRGLPTGGTPPQKADDCRSLSRMCECWSTRERYGGLSCCGEGSSTGTASVGIAAMAGNEGPWAGEEDGKQAEARVTDEVRERRHLDDGYRWRKYGHKAVKNSSFPRDRNPRAVTGGPGQPAALCWRLPSIQIPSQGGLALHTLCTEYKFS
jgi:hypothetical protein